MKIRNENPQLIAIDWGSSNFRAYLLGRDACLLDKKLARSGILFIKNNGFKDFFDKNLLNWLDVCQIPILMSGMVGSRQGWQEVPYLHAPAKLCQLHEGIQSIEDNMLDIRVVPGVLKHQSAHRVEVMRGEETQILGALDHITFSRSHETSRSYDIFCIPGTHSKWVHVEENVLIDFKTYMTGELFHLFSKSSILSKTMKFSRQLNWDAFVSGVRIAMCQGHQLLSDLFQIRTQVLTKALDALYAKDTLSGLLTTCEILEALAYFSRVDRVVLIASGSIALRYGHVLEAMKVPYVLVSAKEAVIHGLWILAKQVGMVR